MKTLCIVACHSDSNIKIESLKQSRKFLQEITDDIIYVNSIGCISPFSSLFIENTKNVCYDKYLHVLNSINLEKYDNYILTNDSIFIIDSLVRFKELFDLILEKGTMFAEFLGYKYDLQISHAWINKIQTHDYHEMHNHALGGDALISGVFYVSAPNSAFIRFKDAVDSYSPVPPTAYTPYNNKHARYPCVPGRLLLFRSDVLHGYDSHNSDEIKFSIAFDLSVKK
jgi:uncharacterized protein (TIGR02466 family)